MIIINFFSFPATTTAKPTTTSAKGADGAAKTEPVQNGGNNNGGNNNGGNNNGGNNGGNGGGSGGSGSKKFCLFYLKSQMFVFQMSPLKFES